MTYVMSQEMMKVSGQMNHDDQTVLAVVYNQRRTTNKSMYFILEFAATVTKGVKQFAIRRIVENNWGK